MRILLIEDNKKISDSTKIFLEKEGFAVDQAMDGERGEILARSGEYDIAILDILLPKKDGIAICESLRKSGSLLPIIMLTALTDVEDKIRGLDSGADDYILKPFALSELLARIRALLRRPSQIIEDILTVEEMHLNTRTRELTVVDHNIQLTLKEFAVLEYLMRNKNYVLSRDKILSHCWDYTIDLFSNIVDAYIKQLRRKLPKHYADKIITIRGIGYKLAE